LNIIDGKENLSHNNLNRSFCNIFWLNNLIYNIILYIRIIN
jgi:hypothetical protein